MKNYKIFCRDCRDVLDRIESDSVDLILTDPPYLTTKESWDKEEVFTQEIVDQCYRVLNPTGSIYVWCGIGEKSQSLIRWFPLLTSVFHFKDLITWKKQRGIGMRKGWLYTREEIMWLVKDNHQFTWNTECQYSEEPNQFKTGMSGYECKSEFKRLSNVWTDIPENLGKKSTHVAKKPVKALQRIINAHRTTDDFVVLDPFMGSGSTIEAAALLGCNSIGVELDPIIFQNAKERLEAIC